MDLLFALSANKMCVGYISAPLAKQCYTESWYIMSFLVYIPMIK